MKRPRPNPNPNPRTPRTKPRETIEKRATWLERAFPHVPLSTTFQAWLLGTLNNFTSWLIQQDTNYCLWWGRCKRCGELEVVLGHPYMKPNQELPGHCACLQSPLGMVGIILLKKVTKEDLKAYRVLRGACRNDLKYLTL